MNQIFGPIKPFDDIDEANYCALAESFRNDIYNKARVKMTVYVSTTIGQECVRYKNAVQTINGLRVLKDSYFMVMIVLCHWNRRWMVLGHKHSVERAAEPLHMYYTSKNNGGPTIPA